jgi:hypothetical protein
MKVFDTKYGAGYSISGSLDECIDKPGPDDDTYAGPSSVGCSACTRAGEAALLLSGLFASLPDGDVSAHVLLDLAEPSASAESPGVGVDGLTGISKWMPSCVAATVS